VNSQYWEICRFLLVDMAEMSWSGSKIHSLLAECVEQPNILMG
jgi:hypothetical protein